MPDNAVHRISRTDAAAAPGQPLLRPFELVALGCGAVALAGSFLIEPLLLKGLVMSGAMLSLVGALLYFGAAEGGRYAPDRLRAAVSAGTVPDSGR
ncbi:MAG: hypothetical protein AAF458_15710 [Pseudomonadota bacterium]